MKIPDHCEKCYGIIEAPRTLFSFEKKCDCEIKMEKIARRIRITSLAQVDNLYQDEFPKRVEDVIKFPDSTSTECNDYEVWDMINEPEEDRVGKE